MGTLELRIVCVVVLVYRKPITSVNERRDRRRDRLIFGSPRESMLFKEGIPFIAGSKTSSDCFSPARVPSKVAATRMFERADPATAVTTSNFETHGGDVSIGPVLVTERLLASATKPPLCLLVEVGQRLATDLGVRCANRRGGRR